MWAKSTDCSQSAGFFPSSSLRCDFSAGFLLFCLRSTNFNPLWVFQCAATLLMVVVAMHYLFVSIPYGFSNALRLSCSTTCFAHSTWFQSLMGFPMRCDYSIISSLFLPILVSIPYGFSNALRRHSKNTSFTV